MSGLPKDWKAPEKNLPASKTRSPNVVYYLIIFITFLASLNALGMTQITALFNGMFDRDIRVSAQDCLCVLAGHHRLVCGAAAEGHRDPGAGRGRG